MFRVADVVDRDVVVLAPEERNSVESLADAEDVASGNLTLTLGHDPVFDANPIAAVRVRPSRDVASGEYPRRARLEELLRSDEK